MNHEPINRYSSPPPLVTHNPTTVMPAAPQYQPPRKQGAGAGTWVAAIATTVTALTLGVVVGIIGSGSSTPSSCTEALEHADELTAQSEEMAELFVSALEAIEVFDASAVDAVAVDIEDLVERREVTYAAYESARDECVEGGA